MVMELISNVIANYAHKRTLVSASSSSSLLSNATINFFPGTPLCNLMTNVLSSSIAYISLLLIKCMWHVQTSMGNLTGSTLFWLLARNFLNWDGVFWSRFVDFNRIFSDTARFFLFKLLIDSWLNDCKPTYFLLATKLHKCIWSPWCHNCFPFNTLSTVVEPTISASTMRSYNLSSPNCLPITAGNIDML